FWWGVGFFLDQEPVQKVDIALKPPRSLVQARVFRAVLYSRDILRPPAVDSDQDQAQGQHRDSYHLLFSIHGLISKDLVSAAASLPLGPAGCGVFSEGDAARPITASQPRRAHAGLACITGQGWRGRSSLRPALINRDRPAIAEGLGDQAAVGDKSADRVDGRQPMPCRERDDQLPPEHRNWADRDDQAMRLSDDGLEAAEVTHIHRRRLDLD